MANIAEVKVHDVTLIVDVEKLTPESLRNMARTALTRRLSLGAKTKSAEDLSKLAKELTADPNPFFMPIRGEGTTRTKVAPNEKIARTWFNAKFLPALKLGNEKVKATWAKSGGVSFLLKADETATPAVKEEVGKNLAARDKIIAAKVKQLDAVADDL